MTAVILLAGRGKRLGKKTAKCLNLIGGKTILERQLNALKRLGIKRLLCVVGYEKDHIKESVKSFWDGEVKFVENAEYEQTNTIYSLFLAMDHIKSDFIYMNGDVIFRPDLLSRLVQKSGDGILGIIKKDCSMEEVKVILEQERIVDIGKDLNPAECYGEFIGVALFRQRMLGVFKQAVKKLVEEDHQVNEYFERGLREIRHKVFLVAANISDIPSIEIDFLSDLQYAQKNYTAFEEIS